MARYTGPKNKKNRRFGLPLKNDKPDSKKSGGSHSERRLSDYGMQLREKQKARFIYGILERQFRNYYRKASRLEGITGDKLLQLLESRLDTVIYRAKFAPTVFAARQMINHGHIKVNKKRVNIASYVVRDTDLIEIREKSKKLTVIDGSLQSKERDVPEYIQLDNKNKTAKLVRVPKFSEVPYPVIMEPNLVIEYYSR